MEEDIKKPQFIIDETWAFCNFHPTQKYQFKKFSKCYRCYKIDKARLERSAPSDFPIEEGVHEI